jgi:hypothetical protein
MGEKNEFDMIEQSFELDCAREYKQIFSPTYSLSTQ